MKHYTTDDFALISTARGWAVLDRETGRHIAYSQRAEHALGRITMYIAFRNNALWDAAFAALRVAIIYAAGYSAGMSAQYEFGGDPR